MAKIAVIGVCGQSTFLTVDKFHELGETKFAKSCFQEIGGKGSNQAIAAARMGAQVSFLGAVGDDSVGTRCKETLEKEGICGCFAVNPGKETTFAFILTDEKGENRVTCYTGAELTTQDVEGFRDSIVGADILLLNNEVPEDVNAKAIEIAKAHGVPVILNPAPAREGSEDVWLVTPNEQERAGLQATYQHCITTLGGEGCSIDDRVKIPALPVVAVDTTGAGDTFNGVLAVCLAEGMDMEGACRLAVKASGISVTRKGVLGAIPTREELFA